MGNRAQQPLVFGSGLDRATGVLGASPRSMRDLRNVFLYRDKVQARTGHSIANSFLDEAAAAVHDVVLVQPMQAEQVGVVVGYQSTDRELHVYLVDGSGLGTNRVGAWGILPAGAHEPPRVLAAEQYRKVFLAHDETRFLKRMQTYYYDPFAPAQLVGLTADLDRSGSAEAIKFRGVARHLAYLMGWGYGTGSDEDRPETVRVSMPGDPTTFQPEHYFLAGARDDPVLFGASVASGVFSVLKQGETYEIVGTGRTTFGIRGPVDSYGIAASRLGVVVNGVLYFWSLEGPRKTVGGQSVDMAWPLDLDAPAPSDLVAEGAIADGFAVYLPGRRIVLFIFGARVYALSIWNPAEPKWSYGELGVPACSGGTLYSGGEAQTVPPSGAPSAVSGIPGAATDEMEVDWTNSDLDGDEIVEIWVQPTAGGAWFIPTGGALDAVGPSAAQSTTVSGLDPGTDYNIALRYRVGPYYSPGSSDAADPSLWPAPQQGTGTTALTAPTLDSVVWSRTSAVAEEGAVSFTPAYATVDVVIKRGGVDIATVTAATHGGLPYTYHDAGITGEAINAYTCHHHTAAADSPDSVTVNCWGGPPGYPTALALSDGPSRIVINWTLNDGGDPTEVWKRDATAAEAWGLFTTIGAGVDNTFYGPGVTGDTYWINVRMKKTTFGVDDFSQWNNGGTGTADDGHEEWVMPV